MTPGELSMIASVLKIFGTVSGWPFGAIIFLAVVGPWISSFLLAYLQTRRFERAMKMYDKNVRLVDGYSKLARDLHDVVVMNTQIMTRLVDSINSNQYCPSIRLEKKAGGPQI